MLNKPAPLSLLADRHAEDNLWDQLKQHPGKPFLVHRLDKGTSGVLLIARNAATQKTLTRAFAARQVDKYYLAWVVGQFPTGVTQQINLPLCKGRKSRYRVAGQRENIRCVAHRYEVLQDRDGVDALTRVRCLYQGPHTSLLLIKPTTGRTHQIRVHLSWLGYPILGDHLYGSPTDPQQQAPRLQLHCRHIVINGQGYRAPVGENFMTTNGT